VRPGRDGDGAALSDGHDLRLVGLPGDRSLQDRTLAVGDDNFERKLVAHLDYGWNLADGELVDGGLLDLDLHTRFRPVRIYHDPRRAGRYRRQRPVLGD